MKSDELSKAIAQVRQHRKGIYVGFAKLRQEAEPAFLRRVSPGFANHAAYKSFTSKAPFPQKASELPTSNFKYYGTFEREIAWICGILSNQAKRLSEFSRFREDFDRSYLLGEYASASSLLDTIEQRFGFSLWLTQRRMDILSQTSGSSARSRFLTDTLSGGSPGLVQFLMSWFTYRCAAAVSRSEYERFLRESNSMQRSLHMLLYVDAGIYADISNANAAAMLARTDMFPIIDRYQIALTTIAHVLSAKDVDDKTFDTIAEFVGPLADVIDDPLIARIAFYAGDGARTPTANSALISLVDQYALGQYSRLVSEFNIRNYDDCCVEAIAIAIRSCICSGIETIPLETWGIDPKSVSGRIATDLHEILRFGPGGAEAKLRLNKLALVHATSRWASSLFLIIERQRHDERVSTPTSEQCVNALRSATDHPILAFCFRREDRRSLYLNSAAQSAPTSPTVQTLQSLLIVEKSATFEGLPGDRTRHVDALRLLRHGDHLAAANILEELASDTSSALLRHEASLLLVGCHLQGGDAASAAELAANLFIEERYFGTALPINDLVSALMVEHDLPLSSSPTRGRISVAIVFDIYSRIAAADRDAERADAFNDVLRKHGVQRASVLPSVVPETLRAQLIYFLRYICIPEVLDQSLVLDDTRSVEDERLAVLVVLTELDALSGNLDAYKDEIREIRTRQVVRDTALKLDQSKIYVNVDGIRRALDVEMRENWNRYKFMVDNGGDFDFADTDQILISSVDDGQNLVMVRVNSSNSERYNLFKRIVAEVRDQFTLNKEYGLNSNLSANIRHGYVERELRAPLVNRNLVTNLISDERGYHPNSYWRERLEDAEFCDDTTLDAFQTGMSAFSARIDKLIERLNRVLLRIRSDVNPLGMFNYGLSETALAVLDRQWGEIDSYDDFMEEIFAAMWDATDRNLKNIRTELSRTALQAFINAMDDLGRNLDELGISERVPSISDAITMAKTDMRAAMERVASWFTLSGTHEYADFDLEIPVQAGLASVKAYYGDLRITHQYDATPQSIMLLGWSMPGFGRLFFQLLDNAAKHGGRGRETLSLAVTAELQDNSLLVRVDNDLAEDEDLEALETRIQALNAEYGQAKAMDLIGEEGGSGYSKVWKLIRADLKRDHDINISLKGRRFVVEILMNAGGIVCRLS